MAMNLFPHYLFGNYIVEIAKLFKLVFKEFKLTDNENAETLSLQVYYGTPRAAFRSWYKRFNGQLILPSLNFYGMDMRRRYDKECPNIHLRVSAKDHYSDIDGMVSTTLPPMHFDVTYQFSMYNNSLRERDKMLHKIMQLFDRGDRSIRWYPDTENYPGIFLYMPLHLEETISDESEIEGLDQNETRNVIKTNFIIVSSAVVPYDVLRIPAVKNFMVDSIVKDSSDTSIQISNIIEKLYYDYTYYSTDVSLGVSSSSNEFILS